MALADRSLGLLEKSSWTRMNVLYTETANKVFSDQRGGGEMEGELLSSRSEI